MAKRYPVLDDISDVAFTSPSVGHVVTYDGTHWTNQASSATGNFYVTAAGDNTTDDTTSIQNTLNAGAGKTVYIPPAASKYKITSPLVPAANTKIVMHPNAIIRQNTKWTPAFDCLDKPDVTIEGGYLRYEGDRSMPAAVSMPGSFRNQAPYGYGAAVWTNSDRTVVRTRVYGFWAGANVNSYNSSTGVHDNYKTKDCEVDILVDTVDMGCLASGYDGLTLRVRGTYTASSPDPDNIHAPTHLIYSASQSSSLSRNLVIPEAYAYDGVDAFAFQFVGVRGAEVGKLYARNCPGVLAFNDCQDISIDQVIDVADTGASSTALSISNVTPSDRITISKADLEVLGNSARAAYFGSGVLNHIDTLVVTRSYTGSPANWDVELWGNDSGIGSYRFRNTGSSGAFPILIGGNRNYLRKPHYLTGGINTAVSMVVGSTEALVEYEPNRFGSPGTYWDVAAGVVGARISRSPARTVYTTTGGAAVTIDAANVTHAVVQPTATTAFTINAPTNPVIGLALSVELYNNSGGALSGVTWDTTFKWSNGGSAPATNPTNGNHIVYQFIFDGTNWLETARSG